MLGHLWQRAQAPPDVVPVWRGSIERQILRPQDEAGVSADVPAAGMCLVASGAVGPGTTQPRRAPGWGDLDKGGWGWALRFHPDSAA